MLHCFKNLLLGVTPGCAFYCIYFCLFLIRGKRKNESLQDFEEDELHTRDLETDIFINNISSICTMSNSSVRSVFTVYKLSSHSQVENRALAILFPARQWLKTLRGRE